MTAARTLPAKTVPVDGAGPPRLPLSWESVAAQLAADLRFGAAPASPASLTNVEGRAGVFRIVLAKARPHPSSLIVKCASPWEAEIQSRIARELAETVPAVYGRPIPLKEQTTDAVALLMEDLGGRGMSCATHADAPGSFPVRQLAAYDRAVAMLAAVHAHFAGELSALPPPKNLAAGFAEAAAGLPDVLRLMVSIVGVPLADAAIKDVDRAGPRITECMSLFAETQALSLVHGDFHPGNVMVNAAGDVRIIDWSTATTGPAEWDLVICGERQIAYYLDARAAAGRPADSTFFQRLRAAVVVRMVEFIGAAVRLVLADSSPLTETFRLAIPVYTGRLLEAAGASAFRGGDPVGAARTAVDLAAARC